MRAAGALTDLAGAGALARAVAELVAQLEHHALKAVFVADAGERAAQPRVIAARAPATGPARAASSVDRSTAMASLGPMPCTLVNAQVEGGALLGGGEADQQAARPRR